MRRAAFQGEVLGVDIDARAPFEGKRLPLSPAMRSRRLLWRLGTATLAAAGLAFAVALLGAAREPASTGMTFAATPPAPPPAWIEISPRRRFSRFRRPNSPTSRNFLRRGGIEPAAGGRMCSPSAERTARFRACASPSIGSAGKLRPTRLSSSLSPVGPPKWDARSRARRSRRPCEHGSAFSRPPVSI